MIINSERFPRWFVSGCQHLSGRPKAEDLLMVKAKEKFLHRTIYESDIENIVQFLINYQNKLLKENPRLKAVDIRATRYKGEVFGWIDVGSSHLVLTRIAEELEIVEP